MSSIEHYWYFSKKYYENDLFIYVMYDMRKIRQCSNTDTGLPNLTIG